jgi:hypothetical protein
MTEKVVMVLCPESGLHWFQGAEPDRCANPGHTHQTFEVHRHRTMVTLPDGTKLTAVSFYAPDPYARDRPPDYGLYLDPSWQPPWPHDLLAWPDFGVPADEEAVTTALLALLDRARSGQRVELGCLGGHGRSGTGLSILARMSGAPRGEAVAWVRAHYCEQAVETAAQEAFVARVGH